MNESLVYLLGLSILFGGLLMPLIPAKLRPLFGLLLTSISAYALYQTPLGYNLDVEFWHQKLTLIRVDRLSRIFGTIFHIAATIYFIYAWQVRDKMELTAAPIYIGSSIGALFAGDLISLFLFWEITAISSVFVVWASRDKASFTAGKRYLVWQVASGVLLLAGAVAFHIQGRSLTFDHLGIDSLGGKLILLSFGIKAGFPLLHNWIQDAYPRSTPTGMLVLASFTTKLAIYALARGYAGVDILIPIGAIMTAFPIFFAVLENDLRRVLAYSLNNQLGYMIVGIGIGTELALNGAAAHAFAHILYKGLLLMSMGAVLHRTGTIKATELGGLHKSMPLTTIFCIIGALSISAMPLLSGFVTKSMVVTATGEAHLTWIFIVLLFASAGVVDHSGIKVPFFSFFAHDSGKRPKEAPLPMLIAMGIASFFCIAIGVSPSTLYQLLPFPETAANYHPYDATHVITMLELLLFAALAFVVLMKTKIYPDEVNAIHLDTDFFIRRVGHKAFAKLANIGGVIHFGVWQKINNSVRYNMLRWKELYTPPGIMGSPWTSGATTLWALVILVAYLVLYYA